RPVSPRPLTDLLATYAALLGDPDSSASLGARTQGQLFIILDQFEEYFLYHDQEDGEGTFAAEFQKAVNSQTLPVHFLISLRDDSLAKLDGFKEDIPYLFDNCLRVEHLDQEAARCAIEKPIAEYNRRARTRATPAVELEPALVDEVLRQLE